MYSKIILEYIIVGALYKIFKFVWWMDQEEQNFQY